MSKSQISSRIVVSRITLFAFICALASLAAFELWPEQKAPAAPSLSNSSRTDVTGRAEDPVSPRNSYAQATEFTYQGSLKDGAAPANANYDFEFALFDAASGGTQIGSTLARNTDFGYNRIMEYSR